MGGHGVIVRSFPILFRLLQQDMLYGGRVNYVLFFFSRHAVVVRSFIYCPYFFRLVTLYLAPA